MEAGRTDAGGAEGDAVEDVVIRGLIRRRKRGHDSPARHSRLLPRGHFSKFVVIDLDRKDTGGAWKNAFLLQNEPITAGLGDAKSFFADEQCQFNAS